MHTHRFSVESPNGTATVRGDCDCGETRTFPASPDFIDGNSQWEPGDSGSATLGGFAPEAVRVPMFNERGRIPGAYTYVPHVTKD